MAPDDRSVGKKPVSRDDGLGGRLYTGGGDPLDGSVDSEKVLREGDVEGWASDRHGARMVVG